MGLSGQRTFVGFGFGAIQSGLFLYEAFQSGHFGRLVVAEVMPEVVGNLRDAGGQFHVNIAHRDLIETAAVGPVQIENPAVDADRDRLIDAIAQAEEIATAIPSIRFYASDRPDSLHRILAAGLMRKAQTGGPRAVIYTAENHNDAAAVLESAIYKAIPADQQAAVRERVRIVNTIIGKMSGIVTDPEQMREQALQTVTPGSERAFLVEAFNRILISQIGFDEPFERGLDMFEEKADLEPFEEAKLFNHNATHALAGYLGAVQNLTYISDLEALPGMMDFLRDAAIKESGAALIRKYAGVDPLFTSEAFEAYAMDLLVRMMNPYLRDTIQRVGRDPQRKLGWNDRLVGAMRMILAHKIEPGRYAIGAAAALAQLEPGVLDGSARMADVMDVVWADQAPDPKERREMLDRIHIGMKRLKAWIDSDFTAPLYPA